MTCPYTQLHVYQLDGRLDPRASFGDAHFLGDWPEGDTSCLFFSTPADEAIDALLRAHPHLRLAGRTCMAYEQWQGKIPAEERVGPFRIVPSWEAPRRVMEAPGFAAKRGFILSGVTTGEAGEVRRRLAALGVPVCREWTRDDIWHTFLAVRRPQSAN